MGTQLIAGIETGGTKLLARVCTVESGEMVGEERWPTSSPEQAKNDIAGFLKSVSSNGNLVAAGIAAFGPLIVDPSSPDCGKMLATPKPGWNGSNLRAEIEGELGIPVTVDSDVNAAAIAEQAIGAGRQLSSVAYVTVGTGIGAGLAIDGRSLKGSLHPEAGHLPIIRQAGDHTKSNCQFHASCAEGLCAGPAVASRLRPGEELVDDGLLIDRISDYLGQLAASLVLAWSPHRIVWGGGIIGAAPLVPLIEEKLRFALGGYGVGPDVDRPGYCANAELRNAGLEGALIMARQQATQGR